MEGKRWETSTDIRELALDWEQGLIASVNANLSSNARCLLKVQIGPVQEFIAQARSTRDLWSGSYLLSWLIGAGIHWLGKELAKSENPEAVLARLDEVVIYPACREQPLIRFLVNNGDQRDDSIVLTPNLPNILVAQIPTDEAAKLAHDLSEEFRKEWRRIGEACWQHLLAEGLVSKEQKRRFDAQVDRFLSVTWQIVPLEPNYGPSYEHLSLRLDGVRQLREFRGWDSAGSNVGSHQTKDFLTGREEAVTGGKDWWAAHVGYRITKEGKAKDPWPALFRERSCEERHGAITLIKRVWHWAYLKKQKRLKAMHVAEASNRPTELPFPSTVHIARHDPAKNEDESSLLPEAALEEKRNYFAVLAFDGDEVGKWVAGKKCKVDIEFHQEFSRRLSYFATQCARPIVEACDGRLIYAGGDDVLALLPADTVLICAQCLRAAYRGDFASLSRLLLPLAEELLAAHKAADRDPEPAGDAVQISPALTHAADGKLWSRWTTSELPGGLKATVGTSPEASVGVAVAHFKSPLQDVVRAAQAAEKRAKNQLGRAALAVSLFKRSGEITEWGCRWDEGGLEVFDAMLAAIAQKAVSGKFPHRVVELISPYLLETSPLSSQIMEPAIGFPVEEILLREVGYALDRQAMDEKAPAYQVLAKAAREGGPLQRYLRAVLRDADGKLAKAKEERWDNLPDSERRSLERAPLEAPLSALIGLCETVAFIARNLTTES